MVLRCGYLSAAPRCATAEREASPRYQPPLLETHHFHPLLMIYAPRKSTCPVCRPSTFMRKTKQAGKLRVQARRGTRGARWSFRLVSASPCWEPAGLQLHRLPGDREID